MTTSSSFPSLPTTWVSKLCALFVTGLGLVGLILAWGGWGGTGAGMASRFAVSWELALGLLLAGLGLALRQGRKYRLGLGWSVVALGLGVACGSCARSPISGICFILTGSCLVLLGSGSRGQRLAEALALILAAIALCALPDFALGMGAYTMVGFGTFYLTITLGCFALALGLVWALPNGMLVLACKQAAKDGRLLIRFGLPLVILLGLGALTSERITAGEQRISHVMNMALEIVGMNPAARDTFLADQEAMQRHIAEGESLAMLLFIGCAALALLMSSGAVRAVLGRGQQLANVLNNITGGMVRLDKNWTILSFSEQAARMIGRSADQLIGKPLLEMFPGAEEQLCSAGTQRSMASGHPVIFEEFYPEPLNQWFECRCYPSEDGLVVYFDDITSRKQAELALRASEERLLLAIDAARMSTWDWDFIANVIVWSPSHEILFGRAMHDFEEFKASLHPEDVQRVDLAIQESLEQKSIYACEFRIVWPDGSVHWIYATGKIYYDAADRPMRMLGVNVDVTARHQAERASLQAAEQQARADALSEKNLEIEAARHEIEVRAAETAQISRFKSEFLANMSHELRSPLNSVLVFSQLLADNAAGNLTAKQVEFCRGIYSAGTDLLKLITDVLDFSKIESGTVNVVAEVIEFTNLQNMLDAPFRHMAESKQLSFGLHLSPELPREMVTSSIRLQQILRNLLTNAVKFTKQGGIELRIGVATSGWRADHPTLSKAERVISFAVEDTGIGVPLEHQALIFEAFRQAETGTNRKYGGTGLGLSISRELAKLLGGELQLVSAPGQGSTFTLYLPQHYADAIVVAPAQTPQVGRLDVSLQGYRVLVVDDDARNLAAMTSLLESQAAEVLSALDGATAIEIIRGTPNVGLVLMDIMMPEMDGYEAIQAIRKLPGQRELPILALTANAMAGDRERCLAAGASDYIAKPVNSAQLLSQVRRWLQGEVKSLADLNGF